MSKMIALVHERAAASRGISWNTRDVRALSQEINELTPQTARKILSTPTSGESRTMQQVRQHVNEGVVLVSSRTHADPIDLPKVLVEYDEVRAARDASYNAYDVLTGAVEGVLAGHPATTYANQLPPEQYGLIERIAMERSAQQRRTPTPADAVRVLVAAGAKCRYESNERGTTETRVLVLPTTLTGDGK
jgi:hypothetical protein